MYKNEGFKQDAEQCDLSHHRQLNVDLQHFEAFKLAAVSQIASVLQCQYSQ